jgi:hypothetical protein
MKAIVRNLVMVLVVVLAASMVLCASGCKKSDKPAPAKVSTTVDKAATEAGKAADKATAEAGKAAEKATAEAGKAVDEAAK